MTMHPFWTSPWLIVTAIALVGMFFGLLAYAIVDALRGSGR